MKRFFMDGKTYRVRWDRILAGIGMGIIMGYVLFSGLMVWSEIGPDGNWYPECKTEDSSNCYWDGGKNGEGEKFWDIDGVIYYDK